MYLDKCSPCDECRYFTEKKYKLLKFLLRLSFGGNSVIIIKCPARWKEYMPYFAVAAADGGEQYGSNEMVFLPSFRLGRNIPRPAAKNTEK